jgi:hypothetical protein
MEFLKNLSLNAWYKVVMAFGAVCVFAALTIDLQLPNGPVALVALGAFFVGLGEWRNHPLQVRVVTGADGGTYKISGYPRNAHLTGVAFDILGGVLIVCGLLAFGR